MSGGTGEAVSVRVKPRWSLAWKAQIVAESRKPGALERTVAARHGVSESLLSIWRGCMPEEPTAVSTAPLVPVHVIGALSAAEAMGRSLALPDAGDDVFLRIALPDGTQLYIGHTTPLPMLCGVLGVLRG